MKQKYKRYPKHIVVKITKGDFKKAGFFSDNCNCLMATAIKRVTGARYVEERLDEVSINSVVYAHAPAMPDAMGYEMDYFSKPSDPSGIGQEFILTRR